MALVVTRVDQYAVAFDDRDSIVARLHKVTYTVTTSSTRDLESMRDKVRIKYSMDNAAGLALASWD